VDLAPGTVLLGKYRIDALIGTGGMGNVVRASHLYLHQSVAIKILLPQMSESASTVQRFLREAQATVKLKSEHSARVIDVGTTPDGEPFMVMEFLDGNDLHQILRHHGAQPPSIVVDLMLQACEGIAEAHSLGIIHRDIKPSNFFVTRRPDGSMLLKILDFGISKTPVGYDELTHTQTILGTPAYMAPEQMKSGRAADPRSDIWSIGVVMYQLITGRTPFAGESYAELVLKVGLEPPEPITIPLPPGLPEVILRCLEKDPKLRHQNVGELARLIAPFATDPIAAAHTAGRVARILQQRSMPVGMLDASLIGGGGLSTPIPLSPAQLTPRSWPLSQATSLSQSAGQVTVPTRGGRGWLIGGILGLCVLAGVGGYAVSQLSKGDRELQPAAEPTRPAGDVPATAISAPAVPVAPAATASPAPAPAPAPAATVAPAEPAPTSTPPGHPAAPETADVAPGSTAKPVPTPTSAAKPVAAPTSAAKPVVAPTSAAKPVPGPAATTPSPAPAATTAKPAPAATKPAAPAASDHAATKPASTDHAAAKPASTDHTAAKPASDSKPAATKPATKPNKKADDLFDTRH
jgi:serine/threonine-protein kinase